MPKCFVKRCTHSTGQKLRYPGISLHHFPRDIHLIQEWLRLAGVQEENLAFISMEILEDKRSDKYRMCSAHFTPDSYVMKGLKRFLKVGARPCIFPESSLLDYSQVPIRQKMSSQSQLEQRPHFAPAPLPIQLKCTCKCHIHLRGRQVDASTQTEASDYLMLSLVQTNSRFDNQHQVHHNYPWTSSQSGANQSIVHQSGASNMAPPNRYLIGNHKGNGFPNSSMRSHVDNRIQEKTMNSGEEPSFNRIGINSWDTAIIKENTPSQCEILLENPRFANKSSLFHPIPNCNTQDYVPGIKKEDLTSGFLHTQDTKSNLNNSIGKPIQWRVMPSSCKKAEELEMIIEEVPSSDVITVKDWESFDVQKENDLQRLEHTALERESSNRDGLVCEIKKENIENEYNHKQDNTSSANYSSVCHTLETEEWDNILQDSEDPGHNADGPIGTDNSTDEEFTTAGRKRLKTDPNVSSRPANPKSPKSLTDIVTSLPLENYSKEKKYVVFESSLDELLGNVHCQQKYCTARIKDFDKRTVGSLLVVFGTCCEGHYTKLWESQPRVNGFGAGNVLLAALLVLTGLEFAKIKELCDLVALQMFSEASLQQYRDDVFPDIDRRKDRYKMTSGNKEKVLG